jgi:hypothetical protein
MDEYILIFRHEDGKKIASPEQIQIWMQQTMDWIGTISAKNKFIGGTGYLLMMQKLYITARLLPTARLVT